MKRRRVAIIGLGMAVGPHAQSLVDLRERVEVAYAFSPSEARRRSFAERFPFPLADSLDVVLSDESVEAVLVLTPPNTHLDLVRRAEGPGGRHHESCEQNGTMNGSISTHDEAPSTRI